MKATVGLIMGDPCGVGPEVTAKLLADPDSCAAARIVLVADRDVFADARRTAGVDAMVREVELLTDSAFAAGLPLLLHHRSAGGPDYAVGRATAEGGRHAIETFRKVLDLARAGLVDSICFAPLNKKALSLAGSNFVDELDWLVDELGHEGFVGLLSYLDGLWASRVTAHVPIKEVSEHITVRAVIDMVVLTEEAVRRSGVGRPRIAVAALNPHAGEGGLFGREEIDVIGPAIESLRARGMAVEGPFSPDTVFLRARQDGFDAVVTMYHDQGQIAMKLIGFDHGVTIEAGLPYPITTPAQGTAFDIAGRGVASSSGLRAAFSLACRLGAQARGERRQEVA